MAETQSVEQAPVETFEQKPEGNVPQAITVSEAARLLASMRGKSTEADAPVDGSNARVEGSEAQAEDADAASEQPPSETEDNSAEETLPPIDPPRSWTTEDKELFSSLPRETQERLAERERSRERELRRGQDESAEQRKAFEAERTRMEQSRQQYESALPQLLQTLQSQQAGEFSDIKTIADVEKLAREDWPRYLQWDVAQKKIAAIQQEMQTAQARQQQDRADRFREFAVKEDEAFASSVPEAKDAKAFEKLQNGAVSVLKEIGFSEQELAESWSGLREFSLRDHRFQRLIRDAYLLRESERAKSAAAKAIAEKKAPPPKVQRPGTAAPANAALQSRIKQLEDQLGDATGLRATRIATELWQARRSLQQ